VTNSSVGAPELVIGTLFTPSIYP